MLTRIGCALALAVSLASCGGGKFKPLSPEPMVWVDSASHDFGTISAAEPVTHIFTVKNTGGKALNISRVQTSCGCTAAVLDHQFLQPGETTRLKVRFDPRGRQGQQSRSLWIHSNDPKAPRKPLSISATIEAPAGLPAVEQGNPPAAPAPQPAAPAPAAPAPQPAAPSPAAPPGSAPAPKP